MPPENTLGCRDTKKRLGTSAVSNNRIRPYARVQYIRILFAGRGHRGMQETAPPSCGGWRIETHTSAVDHVLKSNIVPIYPAEIPRMSCRAYILFFNTVRSRISLSAVSLKKFTDRKST